MTPPTRTALIVGDFLATTGFATVNHALLRAIRDSGAPWRFYILGLNATGDPHPMRAEFQHVYPASITADQDVLGITRLPEMVQAIQPDLLFIHADAWMIPIYLRQLQMREIPQPPTVAWCPPDSPHQTSGAKLTAYNLKHLVTPTAFGRDELVKGGYEGAASVIPYGIDRRFTPGEDLGGWQGARMRLNFPEKFASAFLVGRGDRNAVRKQYPVTLEGFALAWDHLGKPADFCLHFHCQPVSNEGWDLPDLAKFYGVHGQLLLTAGNLVEGRGIPEEKMPDIFRSWQHGVHLSTSLGEGQGLVAFESAACGVAQVLVQESAYGELFEGAAYFLPKRHTLVSKGGINTMGALTGPEDVAVALVTCYQNRSVVEELQQKALAVAAETRYEWPVAARAMLDVWEGVLAK